MFNAMLGYFFFERPQIRKILENNCDFYLNFAKFQNT